MESFDFPDIINLISTEIKQKCSKLQFFSLESLKMHSGLGNFFKGEGMNKKSKTCCYSNKVG